MFCNIVSIFAAINSQSGRFLELTIKPPPKNSIKLFTNNKSLECCEIEKRNVIEIPLIVLLFCTPGL